MACDVHFWILKHRGVPVYLWPIPLSENGVPTKPYFSYFCGPTPSSAWTKLCNHRRYSLDHSAVTFMIDVLLKTYHHTLSLSLSTHQLDVRPFDWWNYHGPAHTRFAIHPRYTAIIDLTRYNDEHALLLSYRRCGRRNEVYRTRKSASFVESHGFDLQDVFRAYVETTKRELLPDAHARLCRDIETLCQLVSAGHGFITQLRSKDESKFAFFALVLVAKGCGNLVLSLTRREFRHTGVAALGTHTAIMRAKSEWAATTFDFNGANSPNRGDDKHSYGAAASLYFDINYGA
jgi:hypothetical protein